MKHLFWFYVWTKCLDLYSWHIVAAMNEGNAQTIDSCGMISNVNTHREGVYDVALAT